MAQKRSYLSAFPEEMIMECFSRVGIQHHRTISISSNSLKSIFSSKDLYEFRSKRGRVQAILYLCIADLINRKNPRWFSLGMKPIQENTPWLMGVRWPTVLPESITSLGSKIYAIAGPELKKIQILDCITLNSSETTSLQFPRDSKTSFLVAVNGILYLVGGGFDNPPEYYCPSQDSWKSLPNLLLEDKTWKIFLVGSSSNAKFSVWVANPTDSAKFVLNHDLRVWEKEESKLFPYPIKGKFSHLVLVSDKFILRTIGKTIFWFDEEKGEWKLVEEGFNKLEKIPTRVCHLDGGELLFFWSKGQDLWCSSIYMWKKNKVFGRELWTKMVLKDVYGEIACSTSVTH